MFFSVRSYLYTYPIYLCLSVTTTYHMNCDGVFVGDLALIMRLCDIFTVVNLPSFSCLIMPKLRVFHGKITKSREGHLKK